ncbi:MAG: alpha-amylase [Chlorobi bacterium]|nr:alpha-amylase [Chlorobiota bacterium]
MFPLIYEINTRVWLRNLTEKYGKTVTLGTVPEEEFRFFTECGFDYVWLMGVWQPSLYSKAIATAHPCLRTQFLQHLGSVAPGDIASSPYSIPCYRVNSELGGEKELKIFREQLRDSGIRLMLDFVPNHLALDNEWLPAHPEYFIPVSCDEQCHNPESCFEYAEGKYLAYGKDPYFPAWTDTLQLNYANPGTHEMMTGNLLAISAQCDAVRCDVAMLVLKNVFNTTWSNLSGTMTEEFWTKAIGTVRERYPEFLFLAESYWNREWELQQLGFDFTYDKPFYDYITHVPANIEKLMGHMQAQWHYQKHLCRFLENHDEPRVASKTGLNTSVAALVLLTSPGMHLVHQDQIDGYKKKIPVQLLRQAEEKENPELAELYRRLFALQKLPVFQEGRIEWLHLNASSSSYCFGYHRFTETGHAFVVANFSVTGIEIAFSHPSLLNVNYENIGMLGTAESDRRTGFHLAADTMQIRLAPHEGVVITCGAAETSQQ